MEPNVAMPYWHRLFGTNVGTEPFQDGFGSGHPRSLAECRLSDHGLEVASSVPWPEPTAGLNLCHEGRRSGVGAAFLEMPPADRDVPGVAADLDLRALAHPMFGGDRKNMSPNR